MKFSLSNSFFLCFVIACNTSNMEQYAIKPNDRMKSINTPRPNDEVCGEISTPGTEDATDLTRVFSKKSCEEYCPDNYEALPLNNKPGSHLMFGVPGYLGIGRCRGHAIVTQQMSLLGVFGTGANPHNCGRSNRSQECRSFYRDIITDITSNYKVRDVPGYRTLEEFSADPMIQEMLKSRVVSTNHRFSAGNGHRDDTSGSFKQNTFNELFKRAQYRQMPYVGIKGGGISDHAVLVSSARYLNGRKVLCVSDPATRNYEQNEHLLCPNYIVMNGSAAVYVSNGVGSTLSKFNLYTDEDYRTERYVGAWRERCIEEGLANNLCLKERPIKVSGAGRL